MTGYELSRKWFDFCFENPEKIKPNHTALYFYCVEHCNRLGWKKKFGLPTTITKDAIGIRSYNTYKATLDDLVEFGFIKMIEKSKNQYTSNIIALSNFDKALDKALDKAILKHESKQSESAYQSTGSIIKQLTENLLTKNKETIKQTDLEILKKLVSELEISFSENTDNGKTNIYPFEDFRNDYDYRKGKKDDVKAIWNKLSDTDKLKIKEHIPLYKKATPNKKFRKHLATYLNNDAWLDEINLSTIKQPQHIGTDYNNNISITDNRF